MNQTVNDSVMIKSIVDDQDIQKYLCNDFNDDAIDDPKFISDFPI